MWVVYGAAAQKLIRNAETLEPMQKTCDRYVILPKYFVLRLSMFYKAMNAGYL